MGRTADTSTEALRLDAADEFPHARRPRQLQRERLRHAAGTPGRKMGGWMRLGNRVNEGYAELSVCLYLPDGRVACQFQRPEIAPTTASSGRPALRGERAVRGLEMEYEGELLVLDDPEELRDPAEDVQDRAARRGPVHFDIRGVSPVHGGEPTTPEQERLMYYGPQFSRGHFNQHTGVRGSIRVGDEDSRSTPTAGATTPGARATGR